MSSSLDKRDAEVDVSEVDAVTVDAADGPDDVDAAVADTAVGPDVVDASSETDEAAPVRQRTPPADRPWLVPALFTVLGLLLVATGVVFLVRAGGAADRAQGGDRAVVDQAVTSQVVGQVSTALDQVLSYDFNNPGATEQAAARLLTGDAATQYKTLFSALQAKAPGQQLTLTAKTVVAGVTSLSGSTAELLVFLDQTSTRASDQATSSSAAQLQVQATLSGDTWKISELLPL